MESEGTKGEERSSCNVSGWVNVYMRRCELGRSSNGYGFPFRAEIQLRRVETGRECKEVGSEDEVARTLRIAKDAQRRANL